MVTEHEITSMAAHLKGSGKTFAEFLGEVFKDQFVEVYLGDSYEEVSVEQISVSYPAVYCGKVIGAYRECLILNCGYAERSRGPAKKTGRDFKLGQIIFINERAIRVLSPVDETHVIEDSIIRSRESISIKQQFGK